MANKELQEEVKDLLRLRENLIQSIRFYQNGMTKVQSRLRATEETLDNYGVKRASVPPEFAWMLKK